MRDGEARLPRCAPRRLCASCTREDCVWAWVWMICDGDLYCHSDDRAQVERVYVWRCARVCACARACFSLVCHEGPR